MAERGFTDPMPVSEVQLSESDVKYKRNPDTYKLIWFGGILGVAFTNVCWFLALVIFGW